VRRELRERLLLGADAGAGERRGALELGLGAPDEGESRRVGGLLEERQAAGVVEQRRGVVGLGGD
jgi:hypothetical protein